MPRRVRVRRPLVVAAWLLREEAALAPVAVLGEDKQRVEFLRRLPHQPRMIHVQTDVRFVADVEEQGAANFSRSLGWGIVTIFSVALVLSKLWSVVRENDYSADNKPFLSSTHSISKENE